MKTGFKDPIQDKVPKKQKGPWDFTAPPYDQRSGCFVEAGDDHGVGFRQPVGHKGNPSMRADTLPWGRKKDTQEVDYVNRGPSYQIDITDEG